MQDSGERETYGTGAKREPVINKIMRPELISPEALMREAKWFAEGAHKYGDRNWEKGIAFTNCIGSMLRHIIKYMDRQDDEDHLAAIRWNAGALCHYEKYNPDMDDRPKWTEGNKQKEPVEQHRVKFGPINRHDQTVDALPSLTGTNSAEQLKQLEIQYALDFEKFLKDVAKTVDRTSLGKLKCKDKSDVEMLYEAIKEML